MTVIIYKYASQSLSGIHLRIKSAKLVIVMLNKRKVTVRQFYWDQQLNHWELHQQACYHARTQQQQTPP